MSAALAVNPAVITPLTSPPISVNRPVMASGMAPAWPSYSNAAYTQFAYQQTVPTTPNIAAMQQAVLSVAGIPTPLGATVEPHSQAPRPILPDINQMETQLKTKGSLLSEIPVQTTDDQKPLAHLQPHAIQYPELALSQGWVGDSTQASTLNVEPSTNAPVFPIKLATTAPGSVISNSEVTSTNSPSSWSPNLSKTMTMILVVGLTLATLVVLGQVLMQEYNLGSAFQFATL